MWILQILNLKEWIHSFPIPNWGAICLTASGHFRARWPLGKWEHSVISGQLMIFIQSVAKTGVFWFRSVFCWYCYLNSVSSVMIKECITFYTTILSTTKSSHITKTTMLKKKRNKEHKLKAKKIRIMWLWFCAYIVLKQDYYESVVTCSHFLFFVATKNTFQIVDNYPHYYCLKGEYRSSIHINLHIRHTP